MQPSQNIIDCYNSTAENYAAEYLDELNGKHLDRILLQAFATSHTCKGPVIDLGCGPGQTTRYLYESGVKDIIGIDICPAMIKVAKASHPGLRFETGDMLKLSYPDQSFVAALAFYSIVHFDKDQVCTAFKEIHRLLVDGGEWLFSFHIGEQVVHLGELLGHTVNIDFYFFETKKIAGLLSASGFTIIDIIEREPYPAVEYPSRRAYIWAKKN